MSLSKLIISKLHQSLILIAAILVMVPVVSAQTSTTDIAAAGDTIVNPRILFTGLPKTYEIAGLEVEGAQHYDPATILGFAGLRVGDMVQIPGNDINTAAKRLWQQALFSKVQITVDTIVGDRAWLTIHLRQQPRISEINYNGMKKGEKDDIQERLKLMKGNHITPNIINRAKQIIKEYYDKKGFKNADVQITTREDLSNENEMIVDINVSRNGKIKVHKIYIEGNEVLSDNAVKGAMKKTNEKGALRNLFKQKKFIESDFNDDLDRIVAKYNEKGYRDARIVSDSIAPWDENNVDVYITVDEGPKYYINDINWVGNTVLPTTALDELLGMHKGDVYNQKMMNKRLTEDEDAVSSIYMDRGYLFFNVTPIERNVKGDSIDLEMRVIEGPQARINQVVINGNDRLYEKVIRRELRVRPGQLYSKSDLLRSYREIASTGHFNPETIDIQHEPNEENGTVDIVFNLESKANDQLELSFGWGQTGIIGKAGIKFTNFSIKNLFHPGSYKGFIPQGEGQTFSISAQTNARYYQAYSFSFVDSWFGGKRPNQLSISGYYSRQTGVNSSYYNSNWQNPYYYSGSGLGYLNNSTYNNYYQNAYENAYDPNKVLQMIGITVGLGKRLSWPDDWFTFQASLTYNWYYLKNWDYLYYMNTGTSNALVLNLNLSRNSIDNPYYTRSGSTFAIDLSLTPPASLFGKKDWKKLAEENTTEAKKERYRWIEYWKLRFKSRTYTPLTNPDGKYTLVFMTRADIGLLGSYNKYLKSPFETFYVGGDGMSGSYTYATETIALRGYDNGDLTPYGSEGYAYTRFGAELHFPFMLSNSTTIYGLAFVEGGNAWTSVSKFEPFTLKRSAGVGLRIFLPMVGLMGIDWAYGFDKVRGERGGSHFHFVLGQEF